MRTQRYEYKNEQDNESLVEHNLTHNSSNDQLRYRGQMDFHSPSRAMIQKESSMHDDANAVWEDAEDCARKLNFLLIAREASAPSGIHRANACAGLRISSAIGYHCHGETLETIGNRIGKIRQVVCRYCERFVSWSTTHCEEHFNAYTPELVIKICENKATSAKPLVEILDEFRRQLTDIFFDLIEAAEHLGQQETEVYMNIDQFQKTEVHPINVTELLTKF